MGVVRSIVDSNLHTPCVFLSISKFIYPLIMCTPKILSFLHIFIANCCALFCAGTVLDNSVYCIAQKYHSFLHVLIKITIFGLTHTSWLRVSKLPPRWFRNYIDGSHLFSIVFSQFFWQIKSSVETHKKTCLLYIWLWKRLAMRPTTQMDMSALHILY